MGTAQPCHRPLLRRPPRVCSPRVARSAATATYGLFALVKPDHLGNALQVPARHEAGFRVLGLTYGARDLAISATALFGRTPSQVQTAMGLRIAMDLTDCAVLVLTTNDTKVRRKVAVVTLGWALLNTAALVTDRRAHR